jgi:hypothetical protein
MEYSQKVWMSFMVLGQEQQQQQDGSFPLRSIDRSCALWMWGAVGRGRGRFIPCVLIQNGSECQMEVWIKGVTYLFDYFDQSLFR